MRAGYLTIAKGSSSLKVTDITVESATLGSSTSYEFTIDGISLIEDYHEVWIDFPTAISKEVAETVIPCEITYDGASQTSPHCTWVEGTSKLRLAVSNLPVINSTNSITILLTLHEIPTPNTTDALELFTVRFVNINTQLVELRSFYTIDLADSIVFTKDSYSV